MAKNDKKPKVNAELQKFLTGMDKQFGERSLVEFGADVAKVESIPTGLASLDMALGVGGFPRGRIIEIYGPEGAGKTTVALKVMATAQSMAGMLPRTTGDTIVDSGEPIKPMTGRVGLLDVEHAFTPSLAALHGVKMGEGSGFYFDQPTGGVEAMQKLEFMINSNLFDIIVVDSVAGLTTLDEQKKDIGSQTIAGVAQLMSSSLKKLAGMINDSRSIVIFINQIREKPAVMFGSPETTPGGRALKFYSSIRLRVSRMESIMDGKTQFGHRMKISVRKNKVAPPFESAELDLYYRDGKGKQGGFDTWADLITVSKDVGVVELNGSSYRFISPSTGEIHKAAGLVKWKEYLEANPQVMVEITDLMNGDITTRYNHNEGADADDDTEQTE